MEDNRKVYRIARRGLALLTDERSTKQDLDEFFLKEFASLESAAAVSKNTIALWRSVMDFDKVVDSVDDVYSLASVICAKYRSDSDSRRGRAVLRCADRCRLITALNRLAELAASCLIRSFDRFGPRSIVFFSNRILLRRKALPKPNERRSNI